MGIFPSDHSSLRGDITVGRVAGFEWRATGRTGVAHAHTVASCHNLTGSRVHFWLRRTSLYLAPPPLRMPRPIFCSPPYRERARTRHGAGHVHPPNVPAALVPASDLASVGNESEGRPAAEVVPLKSVLGEAVLLISALGLSCAFGASPVRTLSDQVGERISAATSEQFT